MRKKSKKVENVLKCEKCGSTDVSKEVFEIFRMCSFETRTALVRRKIICKCSACGFESQKIQVTEEH